MKNASEIRNLDILYRVKNKKDIPYLKTVMEKVGLEPASKKWIGNYSMGMKQRLAIAQAIMEN